MFIVLIPFLLLSFTRLRVNCKILGFRRAGLTYLGRNTYGLLHLSASAREGFVPSPLGTCDGPPRKQGSACGSRWRSLKTSMYYIEAAHHILTSFVFPPRKQCADQVFALIGQLAEKSLTRQFWVQGGISGPGRGTKLASGNWQLGCREHHTRLSASSVNLSSIMHINHLSCIACTSH